MWNEDLEDELIADLMSHLDAPAVRELLASTMGSPTPEQLDRVCTDYQTNPSYHLLGYRRKGVIIGCIGLQLSFPGSAIIRAIAIAPTYRGQGIGSRLLRRSIETFSLTHLVVETDRVAVEFYRLRGCAGCHLCVVDAASFPADQRPSPILSCGEALARDAVTSTCPIDDIHQRRGANRQRTRALILLLTSVCKLWVRISYHLPSFTLSLLQFAFYPPHLTKLHTCFAPTRSR